MASQRQQTDSGGSNISGGKQDNPRQPAHITMGGISINIGEITQSVSVAPNVNRVYVNTPRPTQTVHQTNQSTKDGLTIYEQQTQTFEHRMRNLANTAIDEQMISKLSPHFGSGWRRVFRHLNFADAVIDQTFEENGRQVQETVHKLLVRWTRSGGTPDVRTLAEALVRGEQVHIIQLLHA